MVTGAGWIDRWRPRGAMLPIIDLAMLMVMFPNVLRPVASSGRSAKLESWRPGEQPYPGVKLQLESAQCPKQRAQGASWCNWKLVKHI
jgi:hypothetical protein